MSIGDFISSGVAVAFETNNHQTRFISGMTAEYGKCTTEMLETAKKNLREYFTVVGLTEYFAESMLLMKRAFGWKTPFYGSLSRKLWGGKNPLFI